MLELDVGKPALWWPAGHGEQPLYEAIVSIPGDSVIRKIGFRTLEVVTEKDEAGASMIFRVNGIDIFAKGANWIPADALPSTHHAGPDPRAALGRRRSQYEHDPRLGRRLLRVRRLL